MKIQLNLHGIVTVQSATLMEDEMGNSFRKDTILQKMDKASVDEDSMTVQSKKSDASCDDSLTDKANHRLQIPVKEKINCGMSSAELLEAQEKELQLAQRDRTVEHAKEQKNALESYVYEMRNKLFNICRSFASDHEREAISRSLQETEEWLYGDGDDETENSYTSRMQDLKKLLDPIDNRFKDEEARAKASRDLIKCITDYRMSVDSLPPEERQLVTDVCDEAEKWLAERTNQQGSLPRNVDPVLWSSEIKRRTEDLNETCNPIFRRRGSL